MRGTAVFQGRGDGGSLNFLWLIFPAVLLVVVFGYLVLSKTWGQTAVAVTPANGSQKEFGPTAVAGVNVELTFTWETTADGHCKGTVSGRSFSQTDSGRIFLDNMLLRDITKYEDPKCDVGDTVTRVFRAIFQEFQRIYNGRYKPDIVKIFFKF